MIPKAAFVTGNEKKWAEVQTILGEDVVKLTRANGSIEEVAKWKCREAARLSNGPVITEDTALCFDALNSLPGPYIKWFLESVGLEGLNDMLVGFESKTAKAVCTMAYCAGPDTEPILFQGITTVSRDLACNF